MLFAEVLDQNDIKQRLVRSVRENRVSHAQLFLGPEGSGTLPVALAYAQYLLCSDKQENDSCGKCDNCIRVQKLEHPDLHFSFPVVLSKAKVSDDKVAEFRKIIIDQPYTDLSHFLAEMGDDSKAPVIGTDEAGSIIRKLNYKAYEGEYKILVMWMAELMNVTAANNLLKIIEEPPEQTIFLLVALQADNMLPTILSRTQIIKMHAIPDEVISKSIADHFDVTADQAQNIALLAEGNYWNALKLTLELEDNGFDMGTFRQWMLLCHKKNIPGLIDWADEMSSLSREQLRGFIRYALHIFRQCIIGTYTDAELQRLREEEADFVSKFNQFVHGANIVPLMEEFNKSHYQLERNANPKLVLLSLSFKVTTLMFPKK